MLKIHKAQPIGNETVPVASIAIPECIPYNANVRAAEKIMITDAITLVSVLHNTLPQGTWARVVAEIASQWGATKLVSFQQVPGIPWIRCCVED